MSGSLKTKSVFITGGAQGLGKSFAAALLSQGAKVVFGDIRSDLGIATEKELAEKHGKENVKFIEFDVTDGEKFKETFKSAVEFMGRVDLMVNNAGLMIEDLWEKMIAINYIGTVRGTNLAYEHMRKDKGGKGGRIVNVSSEYGLTDAMMAPVYCGTKHAVRAFTTSMAAAPDVKELGIEYGVLCPGPVDTALIQNLGTKLRYAETLSTEALAAIVNPVERIQSGFMKLVLLDEMNGAILFVSKTEMNFYQMKKVNLGESWPVQKESSTANPPELLKCSILFQMFK